MPRRVLVDVEDFSDLIEQFKTRIIQIDSEKGERDDYVFWDTFTNFKDRVICVVDFLLRLDDSFASVESRSGKLGGPSWMYYGDKEGFGKTMDNLKETYEEKRELAEGYIVRLDEEERLRIDEAYHTLDERCYWSSIVNSAVAIEKRLFFILKSRNKKFLETKRKDLRFSLGALVTIYLENKDKFHSCIPARHDNLLRLVNDYRIVSAHSKQTDIDRSTADAVFNLTLQFLFDEKCRPVPRGKRKS